MEVVLGILGFIGELCGELVVQLVLEVLVELGLSAASSPSARRSGVVACLVSAVGGLALGGLSLLLLPRSLITTPSLRLANLVLTPPVLGLAMAAIGHWRRRRGVATSGLDTFACGTAFALGIALVRFCWAK